jgi:hypothetical protein
MAVHHGNSVFNENPAPNPASEFPSGAKFPGSGSNNMTATAGRPDGCGNDTVMGVWLPQPSPRGRCAAPAHVAAVACGASGTEQGEHPAGELVWADPAALPPDTVSYVAAVITAVDRGLTFTLHGW